MPIQIPSAWVPLINEIHQSKPFVWCWEIETDVSDVLRTVFRICSYHDDIVLPDFTSLLEVESGAQPGHAGGTYQGGAFSESNPPSAVDATFSGLEMKQSDIQYTADGDLPTLTVTIGNAARVVTRYFETGDGFVNQRAAGYLVNLNDLRDRIAFTFRIQRAVVNQETATLFMEQPNFYQRQIPQDRYDARRCRWKFGGRECAYVVNSAAAFSNCDKSLGQCIARGEDMESRNLPKLQPRRFGAFPGVPQG